MRYTASLKKLESDLHENMGSMHVKDIAVISRALMHCIDRDVLLSNSVWFEEVLNNEYCSNLIQQDAFSLMELDDAVDCLSYFIHILSVVIDGDGKASAHYPLLDQYLSETLRFMEL